jgi:hypothetical protein
MAPKRPERFRTTFAEAFKHCLGAALHGGGRTVRRGHRCHSLHHLARRQAVHRVIDRREWLCSRPPPRNRSTWRDGPGWPDGRPRSRGAPHPGASLRCSVADGRRRARIWRPVLRTGREVAPWQARDRHEWRPPRASPWPPVRGQVAHVPRTKTAADAGSCGANRRNASSAVGRSPVASYAIPMLRNAVAVQPRRPTRSAIDTAFAAACLASAVRPSAVSASLFCHRTIASPSG